MLKTSIIICPGIHEPELTESFRVGLLDLVSNSAIPAVSYANAHNYANILVYPGKDVLVLSEIYWFIRVKMFWFYQHFTFCSFCAIAWVIG